VADKLGGYFEGLIKAAKGADTMIKMAWIAAHGVSQGAVAAAFGGDFASTALSAGAAKGFNLGWDALDIPDHRFLEVLSSAVIGGTVSEIGGGNFANGAITGAFVTLFNKWGDQAAKSEKPDDYAVLVDVSENPKNWPSTTAQIGEEHADGIREMLDSEAGTLGNVHVLTYTTSDEMAKHVKTLYDKGIRDFYYVAHGGIAGPTQLIWMDQSGLTELQVEIRATQKLQTKDIQLRHIGCNLIHGSIDYTEVRMMLRTDRGVNTLLDRIAPDPLEELKRIQP